MGLRQSKEEGRRSFRSSSGYQEPPPAWGPSYSSREQSSYPPASYSNPSPQGYPSHPPAQNPPAGRRPRLDRRYSKIADNYRSLEQDGKVANDEGNSRIL